MRALVVRSERVVDEVHRQPRRGPDGGIAIEYLGLVYPVDREGRIDLNGAWFYPSQAPICIYPPKTAVESLRTSWDYETDGPRIYLFLNGSERTLSIAVRELQVAGFQPEHWGRSFRKGPAGLAHDWFVRLGRREDGRSPTEWEVEQIFKDIEIPEVPASEGQSSYTSGTGLGFVSDRVVSLEAELAAHLRARDAAEAAIEELRGGFRREITRANDAAAFLRAALAQIRMASTSPSSAKPVSDDRLIQLHLALQTTKSALEHALADWMEAEESRQLEAGQTAELRARVAALEASQSTLTPTRQAGRTRDRVREVEATLKVFTPSLEFARDSDGFIAAEVADPSDLYGKLLSLHQDRTSVKAKRTHAAGGWFELHFSTGHADDGRLYFKKKDDSTGRWVVLVSDKGAQPRDFEWMASQ